MNATSLLRAQLEGSFNLIAQVASDTSDDEWRRQVTPSHNPVGFTIWHCARSIDWAVHCAIQGRPEVAAEPRWSAMLAATAFYGYEVSMETACAVAAAVSRADITAYAAAVQRAAESWLATVSEMDLDVVPDLAANYRSNGWYQQVPRLQAWIDEDAGTPVWRLIAGPCGGHVRVHIGEVQALVQALRNS